MRYLIVVLAGCTSSAVTTTPAELRVAGTPAAPTPEASLRGVSAFAVTTSPLVIAFTPSPPGTDCHAALPALARLTVLLSDLPPLIEGPTPPPSAIDVAVIAPFWPRSAAQLDLVPETREAVGTLYPDDDAALSGRLTATAATLDKATHLQITASYAVDASCN